MFPFIWRFQSGNRQYPAPKKWHPPENAGYGYHPNGPRKGKSLRIWTSSDGNILTRARCVKKIPNQERVDSAKMKIFTPKWAVSVGD